ncbi:MAG: type I restriction enzyme S subunit [Lentisphaeria bacterium]|jgi:type I restriction enzyme S subunit
MNSTVHTLWRGKTFSEVGLAVIDGDRGTEYPQDSDFSNDNFCLFLSAKNVTKDGFRFNECQFIDKDKHNKLRKGLLSRGDIVLTTRGTVGNIAFFDDFVSYEVIRINSGMVIIRNEGGNILSQYLYSVLRSSIFSEQTRQQAFGSAQPQLTVGIINKFLLPVPPLPQQKKIAKILTNVDKLIENTQALIEKYTAIKQGMMADLFTRGIDLSGTPETNPNHGQLRPVYEDAPELYKETELGWVPKEWEIQTIEALSVGGFKNGYFKDPKLLGEGIKLVNVSDLYQDFGIDIRPDKVERIKVSSKDFNKYSVAVGDIFFTRSSLVLEGIAKSNIVRYLPEQAVFECHVMRLRPNVDLVSPDYLALYCETDNSRKYLMSMAKQVTMTTIAQPDMVGLLVPVPCLNEQYLFVAKYNALNNLVQKEVVEMKKYMAIKKGLMQDLLTGKVRVTVAQ